MSHLILHAKNFMLYHPQEKLGAHGRAAGQVAKIRKFAFVVEFAGYELRVRDEAARI
jgi:hypothetical protein